MWMENAESILLKDYRMLKDAEWEKYTEKDVCIHAYIVYRTYVYYIIIVS